MFEARRGDRTNVLFGNAERNDKDTNSDMDKKENVALPASGGREGETGGHSPAHPDRR